MSDTDPSVKWLNENIVPLLAKDWDIVVKFVREHLSADADFFRDGEQPSAHNSLIDFMQLWYERKQYGIRPQIDECARGIIKAIAGYIKESGIERNIIGRQVGDRGIGDVARRAQESGHRMLVMTVSAFPPDLVEMLFEGHAAAITSSQNDSQTLIKR